MTKKFLILFALLALFPFFFYINGSISVDESYFLFMGNRTLHGTIPYTDYPTGGLKTPAIYYLNALLFSVFREPIDAVYAARYFLFLTNAFSAIIIFFIGRRFWDDRIGQLSSILFLIGISIPVYQGYYQLTEPYMEFFGLLGIFIFFKSQKSIYSLISGVLFGISILFKQPGVLFLAAIFIFLVLIYRYNLETNQEIFKYSINNIFWISFGVLIPLSSVSIYLVNNNAFNNFLYYSFVFIVKGYGRAPLIDNALAIQLLSYSIVWIMSFISLIFIFFRLYSNRYSFGELFSIIWLLTSIPIFLARHFGHYYIQILPVACLLASASLARLYSQISIINFKESIKSENYLNIFTIISLIGLILSSAIIILIAGYTFEQQSLNPNPQIQVANYIRQNTHLNETVLSYPYDPSIYLLSGRNPPINELGVFKVFVKNKGDECYIIDQIKKNKTKYVIAPYNLSNYIMLNKNKLDMPDIYYFIAENYELEKIIGKYHILRYKKMPS